MKLCRNIAWTLSWRYRRKELFYLCLSLAHLLTLCHNEATSRRKGGTRIDPPALQGYHRQPPPLQPWETLSVLMLGQLPFVGTLIGHYLEERIVSSLSLTCSLAYFMPYWSYFKEKREHQDRPPCLTGSPPSTPTSQVWHCWWDHFVVHTYWKPRVKLRPWRPLKSTPMAYVANVEIWPKLYRFEPKLMTPCSQRVFSYIYIK